MVRQVLGTDAVGLFPALDATQCAKLIKEEYLRNTSLKIRTGSWQEIMIYVILNRTRDQVFK